MARAEDLQHKVKNGMGCLGTLLDVGEDLYKKKEKLITLGLCYGTV